MREINAELPQARHVLVTGGTGYLGSSLIPRLLQRGHRVRAIVRPQSGASLPAGVERITGSPFDQGLLLGALAGCDTLVHLVGVPKPSPAKAAQFRDVDLVSIQAAVAAASTASPRPHLVYLSVAQPAPVMREYQEVRAQGEALIRENAVDATILRPWYVLGPGHRWPYLLLPVYAVLRALPATRASALRLGLVTLEQMTRALVRAVENPLRGVRIVTVPEIRSGFG